MGTEMKVSTDGFEDVPFMTAQEKRKVLKQWQWFLDSGFHISKFTQALYDHLIQHCSFIAHFDRRGFYATYFMHPSDTQRFLDQFDVDKGCESVEYGGGSWATRSDYYDINGAMVEAAGLRMKVLRASLEDRELAFAMGELEAANRRVEALKQRRMS
jgi:hypothetical protein